MSDLFRQVCCFPSKLPRFLLHFPSNVLFPSHGAYVINHCWSERSVCTALGNAKIKISKNMIQAMLERMCAWKHMGFVAYL